MQLQNLKASKTTANPKLPEPFLQNHPLTSIQNHFSCFLQKISGSLTPKPLFLPLFPQNPSSLKIQFDNTIQTIGNHAKQALQMGFFPFSSPSHPLLERARTPNFASFSPKHFPQNIKVYALKNSAECFVWLRDVKTGKDLGFFCFERKDAEVLLDEVKAIDPRMVEGSWVDHVELDKVVKLELKWRQKRCFITNSSQIMTAPEENVGDLPKYLYGVPVFQSQNLIVKIGKERYHPVFFKKKDLLKASGQQNYIHHMVGVAKEKIMGNQNHPIFFKYEYLDTPHQQRGDNQDCSLEKIIEKMKESPSLDDNIIFIPLGGTNVSQ